MTLAPQHFKPNAPASKQALNDLRTALPKTLPSGYMAFLERANGGEGFIGERYAQLWRAEELIEVNRSYHVAEFAPNLFLIGSDGGGEAYAFDISTNDSTLFVVPLIGMPEHLEPVANSFEVFVGSLNIEQG
jgi:SMI1/KNR4 family protein SUKH-1